MRESKFTRLIALLMSVLMLLGCATVVASAAAADSGSSMTNQSLAGIKELLNTDSYGAYKEKYADVEPGPSALNVRVEQYIVAEGDEDAGFELREIDGEQVLYTPSTGEVSWKITVPELPATQKNPNPKYAKYAMTIEYYSPYQGDNEKTDVDITVGSGRATTIERSLRVNGEVPFSEARYLTMTKYWVNQYRAATYTVGKGETVAGVAADARKAGYTDVVENASAGTVSVAFPTGALTQSMSEFAQTYGLRFFELDANNNELRPVALDQPHWLTYDFKDSAGYYADNFELVLKEGVNTLSLEARNESVSIKSITLYPYEALPTYEEYAKDYEGVAPGKDVIKIEAELPALVSNKTVYPVEDRSCAINSPTDVTRTLLNTLGGEKWATTGQWVEYKFKVGTSGMYDVVSRFRQDLLDGMYTCRAMSLFSDDTLKKGDRGYYNGSPFAEATRLVYDYNADWQVSALTNGIQYDSNGNGKIDEKDADITYPVYLEKDVEYSIRFEVTLGKMGSVILTVQEVLESINNDYLDIIKLTGITPDAYRDYGFNQVLHDTVEDFVIQSKKLIDPEVLEKGDSAVKPGNTDVYSQLISMAGVKSSNAATIEKVGRLLDEMGHDEDEIAKNLETLKTYIGTLGTFLSDAQTQPLQLDYVVIQPAGAEQPAAMPNFWESLVHEVKGFFQSFVRDYDSMSAGDVGDGAVVGKTEVWFASARDQSQVLRSLVSNEFTPVSKIAVELKLVAGGTLLPSILAGAGPDANLGMGAGDVINYAIRDAINNIEDMYDFDEYVENNFNEAAMIQLGIEDADNNMHYYGLPEAQGFSMMFVRTDILAGLDLEVPKTWDDIMACIPTLQANNMQIGLPTDYKIFMYQQNGELFADKGMRINLDSKIALESFEEMCNLFTMYSFPYKYDAANRFRTGEMPILLGDYTGTYNQLKVFATELEGKWEFIPLPGKMQKDGTINNVSISAVAATVMIKIDEEKLLKKGVTAEEIENTKFCAWEFMKWFTGAECQVGFSNEMVAILGPSAKQATANKNALANMPWTTAELAEVQSQFNNLAAIPNYPGSYIIDRYTNFAFLDAYNTYADPSSSLVQYIHTINKEIERKREEFDLETLSDGDKDYSTLVGKRTAQLEYLKGKISGHDALMEQVLNAVYSGKKSEILNAQADVQATLDAKYTNHADTYRTDLIKVMGYDMTDTTISKRTKEKARHCFYYEVYRETESTVTQLYFVSEYLGDIATLLNQ